jgi:hypothetical protein
VRKKKAAGHRITRGRKGVYYGGKQRDTRIAAFEARQRRTAARRRSAKRARKRRQPWAMPPR